MAKFRLICEYDQSVICWANFSGAYLLRDEITVLLGSVRHTTTSGPKIMFKTFKNSISDRGHIFLGLSYGLTSS